MHLVLEHIRINRIFQEVAMFKFAHAQHLASDVADLHRNAYNAAFYELGCAGIGMQIPVMICLIAKAASSACVIIWKMIKPIC